VYNLSQAMKDLGLKSTAVLTVELESARAALDVMLASGKEAPGVVEALNKKIYELSSALGSAYHWALLVPSVLRDVSAAVNSTRFDALRDSVKTLGAVVGGGLGPVIDYVERQEEGLFALTTKGTLVIIHGWEGVTKAVEDSALAVQRYRETAGAALDALDAVIQQGVENRMIALDNEYQRRLALINQSITDEDSRQQAIAKLDDEFAAKKRRAARALALSTKAMAISQAIISTHEAAAKALAQGGFILGIPWAAIVEALGWIQVALIAKQPIPLAKGAAFEKPTLVQNALVGEAGPEYLLPEKKLRDIVRDAMTMPRFLGAPAIAGMVAGITRAFKDCMFPMSAAIAGFVDKLGVTQIATTAKQMIPLAQGAFFKKPTLLPAVMGSYAVAEAGAAEIVSPEPMMRRIVREESRGGPRITVNFNGPLIQTTGLSDADIRKAGAKLKRQLDYQLARVGG
jgi:hypothetical protein